MPDDADLSTVPEAEALPKKRARFSAVWIVPVVAALVGAGIAVQRYLNEGPTVTITFRSAEGVEAGKTFIKYKDINIGKVTEVRLSGDYARIVITAKMDKNTEGLIVEDSRFWIVKPRITLSGISGIGTLISGNHIGFEPGTSKRTQRTFTGLDGPPPVSAGLVGREFRLRAESLGSLGVGSPVYYRRLNVGQVTSFDLAKDDNSVEIRIFLNAPYDNIVTTNTRFWEASGIDVAVGADGMSVRTQSVLSLLIGGIAFESPPDPDASAPAPGASFPLFATRTAALAPQAATASRFILYFNEPLRGLSVGAPVALLGLPIGEVTEVSLEFVPEEMVYRSRVEITTYEYRLLRHMEKTTLASAMSYSRKERLAITDRMVAEKGMRAQLRSAGLLSGQLYVALDYFPGAPKAKIDWSRNPPQFPVVPGQREQIETRLKEFMARLDKVPMEKIGTELKATLATLDGTLQRASRTLDRVEGETLPEAQKTLEELRRAIASAERLMAQADNTVIGPDAPAHQEMRDALREIARAAQAVRLLADYLERNPSAIIRGKTEEKP